jgi:hypothetical protein
MIYCIENKSRIKDLVVLKLVASLLEKKADFIEGNYLTGSQFTYKHLGLIVSVWEKGDGPLNVVVRDTERGDNNRKGQEDEN